MEKYVDKDFIRNLNKFILLKGKRKSVVAKEIGISKQTLSNYLNGKSLPTASTMQKMCEYFKVEKADFFKA